MQNWFFVEDDSRIEYQTNPDGFTAFILPVKVIFVLFVMPIFLVVGLFSGALSITLLFVKGNLAILFFIILLLVNMWYLGYAWLWNAFGKEIVVVTAEQLTVKHDVLGTGKTRGYPLSEITDLRVDIKEPPIFSMAWKEKAYGLWGDSISFTWGDKVLTFGRFLSENDARTLVNKIREIQKNNAVQRLNLP